MSRKTNIPQKTLLGDHGVQAYRSCDRDYSDGMRLTSFQKVENATSDAIIIRESEFAKPYGEQYEELPEDYSAVEYEAPSYPPWGYDFPGMADPEEYYGPWKVTFFCDGEICYCPDESKTNIVNCSWEIIDVKFSPPWGQVGVSFSRNAIFTHGLSTASGCRTLQITMKARFKIGPDQYHSVVGSHYKQVCECDEEECACDDSAIAWDYDLSAETIAQSGSVSVYITDSLGTGGPYTWSVSPPCFNLDEAITIGLENTLNADADACGPATITVSGCALNEVSGDVRCTDGEWVRKSAVCEIPGAYTSFSDPTTFYRTVGKQRIRQILTNCAATSSQSCDDWGTCTGKGSCSWFGSCITWTNAVCDEMDAGTVSCGEWKCSWPTTSSCASVPGCLCYDNNDLDYYEWECGFGDTCE